MKTSHTLIFLLSILLVLTGLCIIYPKEGLSILGVELRYPTLEKALTKKHKDLESAEDKLNRAELELKMKFERDSLALVDSLVQQDSLAYADTMNSYRKFINTAAARIYFPNNDSTMLDGFFRLLDRCGKSKNGEMVHILHYGDSQIEGDRISSPIREKLQSKFGGYGPGIVPAIQPIPSTSIAQWSSDSLPRYIADGNLLNKPSHTRYGLLAQVAEMNQNVTLSFASRESKRAFPHVRKFSRVRLFLGNNGDKFKATLRVGTKDSTQVIDKPCFGLNVLTWQLDSMISNFKLDLSGKAELYGVCMDVKRGVSVTNIPMRGSSGTYFTRLYSPLYVSMLKAMNVKFIILEFGGNMTPHIYSDKKLADYKEWISMQISYLRRVYPEANLLFIGPADMSLMKDGELQTYPFLEKTIGALKEAALENGAAFWNMYDVMGGKNSMLKWVDHNPAWAATDYIHFTPKGANRIADVFMESFINYYDFYHFRKRYNVAMTKSAVRKSVKPKDVKAKSGKSKKVNAKKWRR